MPSPLASLAPYLAMSEDPRFLAALRVVECLSANESLAEKDWRLFADDPLEVVRLIAARTYMPTNAERSDIYAALASLSAAVKAV